MLLAIQLAVLTVHGVVASAENGCELEARGVYKLEDEGAWCSGRVMAAAVTAVHQFNISGDPEYYNFYAELAQVANAVGRE